MSNVKIPVTIRGVTYDCLNDACKKIGVSRPTFFKYRKLGILEELGLRKRGPQPMPIVVRGVRYESAEEASEKLSVTRNAVYMALYRDKIDDLGRAKKDPPQID